MLWMMGLACSPSDPSGPAGLDENGGTADTGVVTDLTGTTGDTADSGGLTGPDCVEAGCLVAVESLGRFSQAALQAAVDPAVQVDNGYEVFIVGYRTEGGRVATATVTLPIDASPPAGGWPVVANAHGTAGLDDPCRLSGTVSGSGLAGLFGARGAIGVAPDYLGLGGPDVHRYLDLYDEAVAVLDSLRAAESLALLEGVPSSGRSAVVGLSQGGHATLAAATWHSRYAPELDIRAFGAAGPASGFVEHWSNGVRFEGSHLALHAMLTWSFAEAAGAPLDGVWAAGFDPEPTLLGRCGWDLDFSGALTLYDGFPTVPEDVFSTAYLAEYSSRTFDGFEFVAEGFERNRVRPWLDVGEQTAPIAVWQGTEDDVVPLFYTADMVSDLQDAGVDITLHQVVGATHTNTAFGFLASPELATDEAVAWVLDAVR